MLEESDRPYRFENITDSVIEEVDNPFLVLDEDGEEGNDIFTCKF